MSPKQHIIELNGKRYDALTGKILPAASLTSKKTNPSLQPTRRRNVDGFVQASKSPVMHPTQKSKTLMRNGVRRPIVNKVHAASHATAKVAPKSIITIAKAVPATISTKNPLIRKFSNTTAAKQAVTAAKTHSVDSIRKQATASVLKIDAVSARMATATSHEQPVLKSPKLHHKVARRLNLSPRLLSAGSLALAALLIGGFFMYQNVPNLTMRVAAARAGIHGSLPGYQPAGFGLDRGISYKPGQIILGYKSHSDDRNFKIIQSASAWNSETLRDSYVAVNHPNFQVVNPQGKTVYLYDDGGASWVDSGIWYRVEGNSNLNGDQLQNIANSL